MLTGKKKLLPTGRGGRGVVRLWCLSNRCCSGSALAGQRKHLQNNYNSLTILQPPETASMRSRWCRVLFICSTLSAPVAAQSTTGGRARGGAACRSEEH